jgi:hypothetical protein
VSLAVWYWGHVTEFPAKLGFKVVAKVIQKDVMLLESSCSAGVKEYGIVAVSSVKMNGNSIECATPKH